MTMEPTRMIPTIGRIVLVNLGPDTRPGAQPGDHLRPALVVRVWGATPESAINVQLVPDGYNDEGLQYVVDNKIDVFSAPCVWRTSLLPGAGIGQWQWPPRVGA